MARPLLIASLILLAVCGPVQALEPSPRQQYDRANSYFATSRFRDALPLYQGLLASPPAGISSSDLHTRIGDSWFQLGRYADALESYRKSLQGQKETRRAETQYWIGFCCFLLGRDAEAADEFLKIPQHYPESGMWVGTGYYWAGRVYQRMGRAEDAAACYRKAGGNGRTTQGTFALKKAESVSKGASGR